MCEALAVRRMLVSAFYHGQADAIVEKRLFVAATQEVPPHILLLFVRVADYDERGAESASSKHVFLLPGVERQFGFVLQRGEEWWCVLSHSCFVQLFFALLEHLVADPEYAAELNETPLPKPGRSFPPRGDLVLKVSGGGKREAVWTDRLGALAPQDALCNGRSQLQAAVRGAAMRPDWPGAVPADAGAAGGAARHQRGQSVAVRARARVAALSL